MKHYSTLLCLFLALMASSALAGNLQLAGLRCEYRENPLGIDVTEPRLFWTLEATPGGARGLSQSAYQVLVASTPEKLAAEQGDLWDSGKVVSDQQIEVVYAGSPLVSRERCYWKVRAWDNSDHPSDWSAPAMWSMGLLEPGDWQAKWIAAGDKVDAPRLPRVTGYHALEAAKADDTKWVQVDLGAERPIDEVRLYPPTPPGFEQVRGFGFPVRFRIEASNDPDFRQSQTLADHTQADYPNPGDNFRAFSANGVRARYVRVTATRLWNRESGPEPYCFALAELEVLSGGVNVARGAACRAQDSVERSGWGINQLTDGARPVQAKIFPWNRPERTKAEREGQGALESDNPPYAAVLLRKEISLGKLPVRATAYVCGLGYYELYINGNKVGDHVLDPGFTDYTKRALYITYDVTKQLQAGRDAIGVVLGGGWYDSPAPDAWGFDTAPWIAPPKLLLRIDVEYGDGTREAIVSDASWKRSTGPIVFNSIRGGETYDARRDKPGWDRAGYDDSAWSQAKVASAPAGRLMAQFHPPIRIVESIRPVKLTEPKPGVYLFDLGANIAGWARLQTSGDRGQKITLEFNELLNADGTLNTKQNAGLTTGRFQSDEFILAGRGVEVYEPRFTYHGFRYVQVTGLTEKPTLDSLTGRWVHTDPEPAGQFSCSNPLVNRIQAMIRHTQLCNIHGIPTDCPHREKVGWTGDGCITMEEAIYNFGMATFYNKWFRDMLDAQDANGHASCIAPSPGWGRSNPDGSPHFLSDPWWGGAIVRLPWQLYRYYGDRRILEEGYDAMKRYMEYAAKYSPGHISWSNEGDWLEVGPSAASQRTPTRLAGTAAYFYHAKLIAEIAELLGHNEDARNYHRLADEISASFHQKYFDPATGLYAKDSQTAQALPLYFGMTPPDKRSLVLDQFLRNIQVTRANHISSGIIGTFYVFEELMESGHDDLAYAMLTQPDYPGWGYMLANGATTVWEAWNGSSSRNHPALGSIGAWFYQGLGGIRLDPSAPAFKHFVIKPAVVGDLTWVKCAYSSIRGKIESNWRREDGKLRMEVTIPVNTTATVHVPTDQPDAVTESGRAVETASGVKLLRIEKGGAVYEVGSGSYVFEAPASAVAGATPIPARPAGPVDPRHLVTPEQQSALEGQVRAVLDAAKLRLADGTTIYAPCGTFYRGLWPRDYEYFVEGAGDIVKPEDLRAVCKLLISHQKDNGWVPITVNPELTHFYYVNWGPKQETDAAQFFVKLVHQDYLRTKDIAFVASALEPMRRAMDSTPRDQRGLVWIDPNAMHTGYGFTDGEGKSGQELYSSLLYWECCGYLAAMARADGKEDYAADFLARARLIEQHIDDLKDEKTGLYFAASESCRQLDVWGNAYMIYIGFPDEARRLRISRYLAEHYDQFIYAGQVRHLFANEYWERTVVRDCAPGIYQNGGYWGTASGWVAYAIAQVNPALASRMLGDLIDYYLTIGPYESVNDAVKHRRNKSYSASVTLPMAALRRLSKE